MTTEQKIAAKARMKNIEEVERKALETAQARNDLEAFIYDSREKLVSRIFQQVASEGERSEMLAKLSKSGDWLEEEGFSSDSVEFDKVLKSLQTMMLPMANRADESEMRPQILEFAAKTLNASKTIISNLQSTRPWIPSENLEEAVNATLAVENWLAERVSKQNLRSPLEMPAFTAKEVETRIMEYTKVVEALQRIRKPKPAPTHNTTSAFSHSNQTAGDASPLKNNSSEDAVEQFSKATTNASSNMSSEEASSTPSVKNRADSKAADRQSPNVLTDAKEERPEDGIEGGNTKDEL